MSETGSETRSGIGARVRAGRERMGLTQLQMAEKLHVDPKVVESLEGENFDAMGAPVFVRGHLKRYAEFIGENIAELIQIYTAASQPTQPDLTRLPNVSAETNKPSKLAVPALLVLIAFVVLGVFWWIFQSVRSTSEIRPAPNAREVPVEPDFSSPAVGDEGATGAADGTEAAGGAAGAPASTNVASAGAVRAAEGASASAATGGGVGANTQTTQGQSRTPSAAGGAATSSGANTGATNASGTTGAGATSSATPAKPMQVTLKFTADSWVEVYDSKGAKLFYDIGSADSQRTLSGTPPFRVTFGNAPGVSFDVNGKPGTLPDGAIKDDTAQFVINPSGRIVRARAQPQGPQASGSPQRAAAPAEGT